MNDIDSIFEKGLLYDFYGELLNEHQRRIYREVVCNDYLISEIARDEGISRQSVSDMIKRCDKKLNTYEEKLGLVSKFLKTKSLVKDIEKLCVEFNKTKDDKLVLEIENLSKKIINL